MHADAKIHDVPRIVTANTLKPVAVIDWVSFIIKLERPSHGGFLKRSHQAIGVSRVRPLNAGAGGAATEFRVDLQHPETYQVMHDLLKVLDSTHTLAMPPILHGMEVSIDYWPVTGEADELADLTERLMMSIKPPLIANPRLINKFESIVLPSRRAGVDPNMTLYIGNERDDLLWRVYWKRTDETFIGDEGKRLPKSLPEAEWRARVEVRMNRTALSNLGLNTPGDLKGFRFERLHTHGYFKFCRHATGVAVLQGNRFSQAAARSLGIDEKSPACVLGMFAQRDKRMRSLKVSRYLVTDTELTEAARTALRGLTRRI